jgi:hypothetical protein
MSIGPLGIPASAAGSPLAQTKGATMERAQGEVGAQRRAVYHEQEADAAAGVGEPDGEDHETTAERDGDGRRPWEDLPEPEANPASLVARQSKDPSQESGNLLDLTG